MSVIGIDGKEVEARSAPENNLSMPPSLSSEDMVKLNNNTIIDLINKFGSSIFFNWEIIKSKTKGVYLKQGSFKPALMSTTFQKLNYPVTMLDKDGLGESWHYDWKNELYTRGTKDFIGVAIKLIFKDNFKITYVDQTYSDVKYSTPLPRDQFIIEPIYIPQIGSILKLYVKDNKWHIKEIPNTPDLYVTSRWDVKYDKNAKNPLWDKFLYDVFYIKDVTFLQEYCGTILWFKAVRLAVVLGGPTNSGKTTFGFVIENILGGSNSGNVRSIPPQKLNDTYELYRVFKLPLILVNEFPRAKIDDCAILKSVITGATISARTLREAPFDFQSFAKIFTLTNDLPHVSEDGEHWWNKWQVVTVDRQKYDDDNVNKIDHYELFLTGTQEKRNTIFTWMVDGLVRYLNRGSRFSNLDPWEVTRTKWKSHADSLGQFMIMENGWIRFDDKEHTPKPKLYEHYVAYCTKKGKGVTPMSRQLFYKNMQRRYIKVDNPIVMDIKPEIDGKQVQCYGCVEIVEQKTEPPEERDEY